MSNGDYTATMMAQVAQLRVENSTLVQRLQEISQKFQEAAVDNRVLKADVGALRAKVGYLTHFECSKL